MTRPADVLAECTTCHGYIRYGQPYRPGPTHDTCPNSGGHVGGKARIHRRERAVSGRRVL